MKMLPWKTLTDFQSYHSECRIYYQFQSKRDVKIEGWFGVFQTEKRKVPRKMPGDSKVYCILDAAERPGGMVDVRR